MSHPSLDDLSFQLVEKMPANRPADWLANAVLALAQKYQLGHKQITELKRRFKLNKEMLL